MEATLEQKANPKAHTRNTVVILKLSPQVILAFPFLQKIIKTD